MRAAPAIVLSLAVLAAGCVAPAVEQGGETPMAFVDPIVDDHDHGDRLAHALATESMSLVGHHMLGEDGKAFSYIGEIDAHGDLVVVQVIGRGSTPGFVLVDVGDPAAPAPVGRAEMPFSYVVDVKFATEGTRVLAASQARPLPSAAAVADPARYLAGAGIAVWGVEDPAAPVLLDVLPVPPAGCHMLAARVIGGTEYVFCVGETILILELEPNGALVPVSQYAPQSTTGVSAWLGGGEAFPGPFPHDMTVVEDPLDGTPTMYVSYWDLGVRVVDVSDPRMPRELGAWAGDGASRYEGNVHSAMPIVIDGTRYVVAAPELLGNTVPAVWVLDASDYGALALAAEWLPPGEHGAQSLRLTTHQFQLVDGRMYMAYNHAGVWVLDLRAILDGAYVDDASRPEVLGYYLPHEDVPVYDPETAVLPNTWDVVLKDGYIYASDRYTGLYVLHYAGDTLGDPALTSFA